MSWINSTPCLSAFATLRCARVESPDTLEALLRARGVMDKRLRQALVEEMQRSAAIASSGEDVMPRFRILTPEGDFVILVQIRTTRSTGSRG